MTRLRTQWGIDLEVINSQFDEKLARHFQEKTNKHLKNGLVKKEGNVFRLTREGKFFADRIASEIFAD
jgi:oxygen-independent coproporphyrinogen-3 oxidase